MMGPVRKIRERTGMDEVDFLVCITLCSPSSSKWRENLRRRFPGGTKHSVKPPETDSSDAELSVLLQELRDGDSATALLNPETPMKSFVCRRRCVKGGVAD
jgi:hypothetical protein